MPLPQTNYIDAGPGVPLANPSSSMAQGKAYAEMGNTIAAIGQRGMEIAGRLRQVKESGEVASLWADMEKDASDFQISLMTRDDMDKWPQEWKQRSEKWKGEAKKRGLSPDTMAKFDERFLDWNTRRSISFETQAATKTIEVAKGQTANAIQYHLDNQNYEMAIETARNAGGLYAPHEVQALEMKIQQEARHNDMLADIDEDPEWLDKNKEPQPGYSREKWASLRAYARSREREKSYAASGKAQDLIVSGHDWRDPRVQSEIAKLRPTDQAEMKGFYEKWQKIQAEDLYHDPANIKQVTGEFDIALSEYKPITGDKEDKPGIHLGNLVNQVPPGAIRDDMQRRLKSVLENQRAEAKTELDLAMVEVDAARERGQFGIVPEAPNVETRKAVRDGFLLDIPKLQSLGFSRSQAEDIRDAAREDPALGQKKYRELWESERPQASVNAAPFDIAVSDAIRGENSFLQWKADPTPESLAKKAEIERKTGAIRIHMTEWARKYPEDARDREKINKELQTVTGLEIRRPTTRITPRPAPPTGTETSMTGEGVNPNVDPLYKTVSAKFPSVESWGIWGDAKHQARKSDHNTGDAIDIAIKDNDGTAVAAEIEANATAHNVKYMIHNGRIWKPSTGWQDYTGKDKHSGHVHVSFNRPDKSMASR
jgi:hypothetical protein